MISPQGESGPVGPSGPVGEAGVGITGPKVTSQSMYPDIVCEPIMCARVVPWPSPCSATGMLSCVLSCRARGDPGGPSAPQEWRGKVNPDPRYMQPSLRHSIHIYDKHT